MRRISDERMACAAEEYGNAIRKKSLLNVVLRLSRKTFRYNIISAIFNLLIFLLHPARAKMYIIPKPETLLML
jgi:hypothetical protein